MAYDGKLKFNTAIDTAGFLKGIENIGSIAKSGISSIGNFAQSGINSIGEFAQSGIQSVITVSEKSAEAISKSIELTLSGMKTLGEWAVNLSKQGIEIGKSFESSMSQVAATMGITKDTINASGVKPFEILSEAAKECGATTQFSASEAAEALNYLALAGYTAEQAADALPSVLNLAAAGGLDLQYAADLATDAMAALGITANNQNLTEFGDKMAKAAQKSNTSVRQLGEAILTVGGTAKELAGGTTELNTALGVLANVGIKGSEGGTALRNIMLAMTPTTDKAVAAFEKLNVSAYDATTGALRPLNDTFKDLNKAMSGMNSKEKTETLNAIFNKVDLKSASAMLSACASNTEELGTAFSYAGVPAQHLTKFLEDFKNGVYNTMTETEFCESVMNDFGVTSDKAAAIYSAFVTQLNGISFENLYNEIENCDGAMEQMAETMNDNLEGDIKIWNSALEGLGNTFYESIVGNLRKTVQDATSWIGHLDGMFKIDGFNGLAVGIGDVFKQIIQKAYLEIPKALSIGGSFISTLCDGILNSLPQIKVLGSRILLDLAESFSLNFNAFYETGILVLDALLEGLANNSGRVAESVSGFIFEISSNLSTYLPTMFDSGAEILTALLNGFVKILPKMIGMSKELIKNLLKTIRTNLPNVLKAGEEIISAILNGTLEVSVDETMLDIALDIITSLTKFILENIPALLDAGLDIIENILEGAADGLNQIMPFVTDFIERIGLYITKHFPKLLETGLEILTSIINGITDNLPILVDIATYVISTLAQFISENTSLILDSAFEILMALINGIIDNIPTLVGTAINIILSLAQFLSDNVSLIIDSAVEIVTTLCDELLTAENIKLIVDAAIDILKALAKGVADNLPKLIECATNILQELGNYLNDPANQTELMEDLGELVGMIVKGLLDSLEPLADFVGGVLVELGRLICETDWSGLGEDITNGIMSGILDVDFSCQEFGENFKENWISGFKDIFQIHSPSRLMRDEIGVYIVPGIAEGISDTSEQLTDEMNTAVNTAVDNVDTSKSIKLDISADALTDTAEIEKLSERMKTAVMEQQLKYSPVMNMQSNISGEIKSGMEDALKNAKLDGDTYLSVNIGQERFEDMVISAVDKYNARTGGRY